MIDPDILWLWLNAADGVGPATANDLWAALAERGLALEDFFALGEEDWAAHFGLNRRAVRGLAEKKNHMEEVEAQLEALREAGVGLLSIDRPDYPQLLKRGLGRGAPALLYTKGNRDMLELPAVGVVGSRDASARGLAVARLIGNRLGERGGAVVSGGAKGIDAASHLGALEGGGATVVVLSCGILRYRPPSGLREMLDSQSALFLSESPPRLTWDAGAAMARNRIVCALASALVVVEAKESGGTLDAARRATDMGLARFVVKFDEFDAHSAGNRLLLREGCRSLKAACEPEAESWSVDVEPVVAAMERRAFRWSAPEQPDLFSQSTKDDQ